MADLVYLREAKGLPPLDAQQATIRAAGVAGVDPAKDQAWHDAAPKSRRKGPDLGLPQRAYMLKAVRRGDVVVVAVASCLAASLEDALPVLEQIARQGGSVRVALDGFTVGPEDGAALVRFAQRIASEAAKRRTAAMAAGRVAKAQRSREDQGAAVKLAAELWVQPDVPVAAITARTGISGPTLYRWQRQGILPQRQAMPRLAILARANAAKRAKKP